MSGDFVPGGNSTDVAEMDPDESAEAKLIVSAMSQQPWVCLGGSSKQLTVMAIVFVKALRYLGRNALW